MRKRKHRKYNGTYQIKWQRFFCFVFNFIFRIKHLIKLRKKLNEKYTIQSYRRIIHQNCGRDCHSRIGLYSHKRRCSNRATWGCDKTRIDRVSLSFRQANNSSQAQHPVLWTGTQLFTPTLLHQYNCSAVPQPQIPPTTQLSQPEPRAYI